MRTRRTETQIEQANGSSGDALQRQQRDLRFRAEIDGRETPQWTKQDKRQVEMAESNGSGDSTDGTAQTVRRSTASGNSHYRRMV